MSGEATIHEYIVFVGNDHLNAARILDGTLQDSTPGLTALGAAGLGDRYPDHAERYNRLRAAALAAVAASEKAEPGITFESHEAREMAVGGEVFKLLEAELSEE